MFSRVGDQKGGLGSSRTVERALFNKAVPRRSLKGRGEVWSCDTPSAGHTLERDSSCSRFSNVSRKYRSSHRTTSASPTRARETSSPKREPSPSSSKARKCATKARLATSGSKCRRRLAQRAACRALSFWKKAPAPGSFCSGKDTGPSREAPRLERVREKGLVSRSFPASDKDYVVSRIRTHSSTYLCDFPKHKAIPPLETRPSRPALKHLA